MRVFEGRKTPSKAPVVWCTAGCRQRGTPGTEALTRSDGSSLARFPPTLDGQFCSARFRPSKRAVADLRQWQQLWEQQFHHGLRVPLGLEWSPVF